MSGGRRRRVRAAVRWSEHGATCWRQYASTGDPEALRYCLQARRLALAALPAADELTTAMTQDLVAALDELHAVTGEPEPADETLALITGLMRADAGDAGTHALAVRVLAHAAEHDRAHPDAPLAHHATARQAFVLTYADISLESGRALVVKARDSGDIQTLEQGIRLIERALAAPTDDPQVRSDRIHARALGSAVRWQLRGWPGDLDAAIDGFEAALSLVDPAPMDLHHNLALAHVQRYYRDGEIDNLHTALRVYAAAPHRDDPAAAREWRTLMADLLWTSYEVTADLDELDAAIGLARQLVSSITESGLRRDQALTDLRRLRDLLAARSVYRRAEGLDRELAELDDLLDDAPDPSHVPTLLPWTRTYD